MKDVYKRRKAWVIWGRVPSLMLLIVGLVLLGASPTFAQDVTVSGKVTTGDTGETLPGVTVVQKGSTNGTITNVDGNYSIKVKSDAVLVFSYLGYKSQEVLVSGRSTIDVSMAINAEELEEVVVTGYAPIRKNDLTAAQTSISSKEIELTVNTTIDQAIAGRSAGVLVTQNTGAPGGGISVSIRGLNSIGLSNEPLYVIDGVQIKAENDATGSNPLSSLNPADVASLEILQGPSAIAVYGSRGTNGVVVITTKRGQAGDVKISYGYTYSLQTAPQKLDVMNLREYAQMENEVKSRVGGDIREDFLDPSILGEGTDWQSELFSSAAMQKHQLSLSGGKENASYYLSAENFNQEGIAAASGFERSSVRLNLDTKPRDWFSLGTNLNFSQTDQKISNTENSLIVSAIQTGPQIPVRNIDGTFGGGSPENTSEQFTPPNPIGIATINTNKRTEQRFRGGINLGFKIFDGLELTTSATTDVAYAERLIYEPAYFFGVYNENKTSKMTNYFDESVYWNWNQMLTYTKDFGKHHIQAMALHEAQSGTWKRLGSGVSEFSTDDVLDVLAGNSDTAVPYGGHNDWALESYLGRLIYNYGDRYILTGVFRADGSSNFGAENKWGYFPSLSGAWRVSEESFFNVPFISDMRIRYEIGLSGNNGPGGNIFGRMSSALPTTWGSGFYPANYANPDYQWEETMTNNAGLTLGLFDSRVQLDADYYVKNTDNLILQTELPWYMGTEGNAAVTAPYINIGSLENRGWAIQLSTTNINTSSFKWESNFNISSNKTELTELAAGATHITIEGQDWFLNNFAQRATVGESPWQFFGYEEEGLFQSLEEIEASALPVDNNGEEYAVAENSIWVGDVKYKDQLTVDTDGDGVPDAGDGIIDENDMTYIGNPFPKVFGGFTNTFSYKGFDLSIFLQYSYGNEIYNYLHYQNSNPNNINLGRNMYTDALDFARVATDDSGNPYLENPGTNVARVASSSTNGNYDRMTDKYVEDGSYIRVKSISLKYRLPSSLLDRQSIIRNVSLTLSAQNVFTFTKYSGYDPEIGSYVGPNESVAGQFVGVDYGRYPLTPVYSFSIGVDF